MLEFFNESYIRQPLYSVGIVVLAFFLYTILKLIIKRIILRITAKTETELDDKIALSFKRHSKHIIIFLALYYILKINSGLNPGIPCTKFITVREMKRRQPITKVLL